MEKDQKYGQMVPSMMGTIKNDKSMGLENMFGVMVLDMMDNGQKIKLVERYTIIMNF